MLKALVERPSAAIDFRDSSNVTTNTFKNESGIGTLFRPIKKQITLRLDGDVLAWAKQNGSGYQSRINAALRRVMQEELMTAGNKRRA